MQSFNRSIKRKIKSGEYHMAEDTLKQMYVIRDKKGNIISSVKKNPFTEAVVTNSLIGTEYVDVLEMPINEYVEQLETQNKLSLL